jgi:hypothetical protein
VDNRQKRVCRAEMEPKLNPVVVDMDLLRELVRADQVERD